MADRARVISMFTFHLGEVGLGGEHSAPPFCQSPTGTRACHKSIFSVVVIDWGGVKESVDPGRGKAN